MNIIFSNYENVLIGRDKEIGNYHFHKDGVGGANQQIALDCIRYAIENLLHWDIEKAVLQFDEYIIQKMRLKKLISYIRFPIEVDYGDPQYILYLLYPKRIRLDRKNLVEKMFKDVLKNDRMFPREYFSGGEGFYRFCICLKYIIENYKTFYNISEIYEYFLSGKGKRLLYRYRLKVPADQFSISITDCIYYITSEDPDSEFYYLYYRFLEKMKSL